MSHRRAWPLLAVALLVGCGPSGADKSNMREKVRLDSLLAQILKDNEGYSCVLLEMNVTEHRKKHGKRIKTVDAWWAGVDEETREALIDAHRSEMDAHDIALLNASKKCPAELRKALQTEID